jgi:hypothetical protein
MLDLELIESGNARPYSELQSNRYGGNDGMRVLTTRGFLKVLGRSTKQPYSADKVPPFLAANNLQPFIDAQMTVPIDDPNKPTMDGPRKPPPKDDK